MKSFSRKISLIIAVLAFIIFFVLSALFPFLSYGGGFYGRVFTAGSLYGQQNPGSSAQNYDYVLVIDESGSMKQNDPQNLRLDAAKLFIFLAETLNKGNRVLVSGFGQKTNIYLPMTEVSGNEEKISQAIDSIKSGQSYTDMKGALEYIKNELDFQAEKNKTVLIFLTDGSLTIDDIPPEVPQTEKPSRDRPAKPSQGDEPAIIDDEDVEANLKPGMENIKDNGNINIVGYDSAPLQEEEPATEGDAPKRESDYLEIYKKELIELCQEYKYSQIIIHPIAFTKEAEVSILETMADITGGICYKPQEAKDLRISFIEILRNISSRFIKIQEQQGNSALEGDFETGDYIKELVVIGLKNNYVSTPEVKLYDPNGRQVTFSESIDENIFRIGKIAGPDAGKWRYQINGDAIFVYDILEAVLKKPQFWLYSSGAEVPVEIDISGITSKDNTEKESLNEDVMADFTVAASVESPSGASLELADLNDEGNGYDFAASDGIYSAIFTDTSEQGYYEINYEVINIPTGAVSARAFNFETVRLPVIISQAQPLDKYYQPEEEIKIAIKVQNNDIAENESETQGLIFTADVTSAQGAIIKDILLLDNGQGADMEKGDGIYSAFFTGPTSEGSYIVDYFISTSEILSRPACSGIYTDFKISAAQKAGAEIKNSYFTGEPALVSIDVKKAQIQGEYENAELIYTLLKPDGSESTGMLYDDGNIANSDTKAGDGIYSAALDGLDITGKYEIKIEGTLTSQKSPAPDEENAGAKVIYINAAETFYKYFEIKNLPESILLNEEGLTGILDFTVFSSASYDAKIFLGDIYLNSKKSPEDGFSGSEDSKSKSTISGNERPGEIKIPIKSAVLKSGEIIKAGIQNNVEIEIMLDSNTEAGNYLIQIPFKIDDSETKTLEFDIAVAKQSPPFMLILVIAAGVLLFTGIILLVYFLYIKPRKSLY